MVKKNFFTTTDNQGSSTFVKTCIRWLYDISFIKISGLKFRNNKKYNHIKEYVFDDGCPPHCVRIVTDDEDVINFLLSKLQFYDCDK